MNAKKIAVGLCKNESGFRISGFLDFLHRPEF
jgi:hypothetical protein